MLLDKETDLCFFSKRLLKQNGGPEIISRVMEAGVDVKLLDLTRDIWCRDYMPIQTKQHMFIGYEYTPDYLTKSLTYQTNPARICRDLHILVSPSGLILDGGNIVKTSKGAIVVDKVFSENRNFPMHTVYDYLKRLFDDVTILPWDKVDKYGHADGIVREIDNGRLLMTNYHQYDKRLADKYLEILSKKFDVEVLNYDVENPCPYNWCYINYLRVGNKVFVPQLTYETRSVDSPATRINSSLPNKWYTSKIEEDDQAIKQFKRLFRGCEIIPVSCPQIVEQGGALNCISWNVKNWRSED